MQDLMFLILYLVLLAFVVLVPHALRRFQVPSVIAIMAIGIIIGPHALGVVDHLCALMRNLVGIDYPPENLYTVISALGVLGLVFLMALAGMEVDIRILAIEKRAVLLLSVLTFAVPALAGFGVYAMFRPEDTLGKFVYASLFASHSVGIVFPVIRELGVSRTRFGVAVLGSTVVTDVLSLIMLAVCIQYKRMGGGASMSVDHSGISIFNYIDTSWMGNWFGLIFVAVILLYIAGCVCVTTTVWKRILTFKPNDDVHVTYFLFAVLITIIIGELIGVNMIIGAFVAGLAIVRAKGFTERGEALRRKLEGIGFGIMIPFLFLRIGMDSQPGMLVSKWGNVAIAVMTVVGLIGSKVFSGWLALRLAGFSHAKGLCAGLMTVPQLSATLAAAAVAKELDMLDENFFNAIVVLSLVTTLPVPTLVKFLIAKKQIKFDDVSSLIPEDMETFAQPQLLEETIGSMRPGKTGSDARAASASPTANSLALQAHETHDDGTGLTGEEE